MDNNDLIMDKLTKICTCNSVSRHRVKKAIANGYHDLESIRKKTGAGDGYCKGNNCTEPIMNLIDEYWNSK